ncbi:MAG: HAD hydrolase family protein [Rhodospirillaceae bacterium]
MNDATSTKKPHPEAALELLAKVRLLSVDVDGVLTDGGIYYADDGNSFRKFNAKDGMGLVALHAAGVEVTILSAGAPGAIEHRAARLGIQHVYTDVHDKLALFRDLAAKLGLDISEAAHMGDDVNDLPLMQASGLGIAPADAVAAVLDAAQVVTRRVGGDAAVREVCDAILKARTA